MIKKIRVGNAIKEAKIIRGSNRIPQKSVIVEKIINDVIKFGDNAIIKYTKKYDKVKIDSILVDKAELRKAYKEVTTNQLNSLKKSKKLLEKNEKILLERLTGITLSEDGVRIEKALKPIDSVGCYGPGGDLATLDELCADALSYAHSSGTRDTKSEYLGKIGSGYYAYRRIDHPVERVEVVGDTAIVVGRMTSDVEVQGVLKTIDNLALAVWTRQSGGWRLLAYAPTTLPR